MVGMIGGHLTVRNNNVTYPSYPRRQSEWTKRRDEG